MSQDILVFLFQVRGRNSQLLVFVNGVDESRRVENVNDTFTQTPGVRVTRSAENTIVLNFANGVQVTITITTGIPNFALALPPSNNGATIGLLGNFDGDMSNDFVPRDGTVFPADSPDRDIHGFGQTC